MKTRAYLMQTFMELDMKKFSYPKVVTFGVWILKTSLGQFGPKDFHKGLINPLVENPKLQFSKTGTHFLKNHEINPIKL